MKEVLDVGDRVRIRFEPGCAGEAYWHPIAPVANGLTGRIGTVNFLHHGYIVVYDQPIEWDGKPSPVGHGYYSRDELELL